MGQFTPTTVTDGQVIDPAVFNANMNDIQSAYDTIDDSNLVNGSISVIKLAEPYGYIEMQLFIDTVPISQADVQFDQIPMPDSAELVKVKAICTARNATASADIKDSVDGTLLNLSLNISGAASNTVIIGSVKVATKDRSENDIIRLHCTTDGTGTITNLRIILLFKKLLSS